MNISRRQWLTRLAVYGSPVAAFGYGSLIESNVVSVTEAEIPLPDRHAHLDGLKIAVMGDFHHDDWGSDRHIRAAVNKINDRAVDVVILVGDYISDDIAAMEPLCAALSGLRPRLGTFAILGNHDCWHFDPAIPRLLGEVGIHLLVNESRDFGDFVVTGLDSFWGGKPDLPFALDKIDRDKPVFVGWHEPDLFDMYDDPRVFLQLSGHTHGGQVCAPFYGPLLLPKYGEKYPYGHYLDGDRSLFVTRGIGTLGVPARFLCPPEVALLTMTAKPT